MCDVCRNNSRRRIKSRLIANERARLTRNLVLILDVHNPVGARGGLCIMKYAFVLQLSVLTRRAPITARVWPATVTARQVGRELIAPSSTSRSTSVSQGATTTDPMIWRAAPAFATTSGRASTAQKVRHRFIIKQ